MSDPEQDLLQIFVDDLRAHGVLPPPRPWQDAVDGKISIEAAVELRRPFESPEEIERNKRLFASPSELEIERVMRRQGLPPSRGRLTVITMAAAVAAAAAVWCLPTEPTVPPLSSYQATCHSCHRANRGIASDENLSHDLDARVHWEFTSARDETFPIEMIVFAGAENHLWRRLELGPYVSGPAGRLRVRAERLRDLLGEDWTAGSVELRFIVARPGVVSPTTDVPPDCEVADGMFCQQIHLQLFSEGR